MTSIKMIPNNLIDQEVRNSGTSNTKNKLFDRNGYLLIRDLIDPQELYCEVPIVRGSIHYHGSMDKYSYEPSEPQVNGSISRYYYPPYKEAYYKIKKRIESIIGEKLYTTYYYDRFYFPGQELKVHVDRPSCEISVTIHIRSNLKDPWAIWIKGSDVYDEDKTQIIKRGENYSAILGPGDALLYKGCERPHWRNSMPGVRRNKIRKFFKKEELFYHQVFFHYVLANGNRAHYCGDILR